MSRTKVADALEKLGLSVAEMSEATGVNDSWGWDLLGHESELYYGLSLRQLCNLASFLRVPPLSLLSDPPAPAQAQRPLSELAVAITAYCSEHSITVDAFGDLAGWDVTAFLEKPETAPDDWCLDTLRDICRTLNLHWPDFFSNACGL